MAPAIHGRWLIAACCLFSVFLSQGQRFYTRNSVLASGNWYRIGVTQPGVYKIDLSFLTQLGVPVANLSSETIRIYGNGGHPLPEAAGQDRIDDLAENALWIEDGGDGILNGADYLLFYAGGPHQWITDSVHSTFQYQRNNYSDTAYYFLTLGGKGLRIASQAGAPSSTVSVSTFNTRFVHERDSVNLLSSGQQWYGEEFSSLPGQTPSRMFPVILPGGNPINQGRLRLHMIARSIGNASTVSVKVANQKIAEWSFPAVGSGPYDLFAQTIHQQASFETAVNSFNVSLDYASGSFSSQAWLDRLEVHARAALAFTGNTQLSFRDWNSVGPGQVAGFRITGGSDACRVWEVTQPQAPVNMSVTVSGTAVSFNREAAQLREYIAFSTLGTFPKLFPLGKVGNQDLHGLPAADYLIIAAPHLLSQAQRLSAFHEKNSQLRTRVVTTLQVYNEFASGIADPAALRDFVKMFYDRAGADSMQRPRYLLLFGDASFDYKNRIRNNTSYVVAYESRESLDPLNTYTSDDFFGFLDDGDDINGFSTPLLDLGIGRIPARSEPEAAAYVDKVIDYHAPATLGSWRNELTFVADDEDQNLHLDDAEVLTRSLRDAAPSFALNKIYLDAFLQEGGAGGSRYPQANQASNNAINNGTLIWNYSGHGSFRRLSAEVILDQAGIDSWKNAGKLPLMVTATCDVAPFDNPLVASIGENLLLRPKTGAIALMTTTRLVFAFSNRIMNKNYLDVLFQPEASGSYPSLGHALKKSKNLTYSFFGDPVNHRKFTLLGDPALTLSFPKYRVRTTHVNNQPAGTTPDTLKALSACTIRGEVVNFSGERLRDFNGTVVAEVLDKPAVRKTLGNDPTSPVTEYEEQQNRIFRGQARVEAGVFEYSFVVPRDIDYRFGFGRIRYYADDGKTDANGSTLSLVVGGTGAGSEDQEGPRIRAWLNDERFTEGGLTNSSPVLLLQLHDSSGINIFGRGIGHDLTARLDDDPQKTYVLNAFYTADRDSYRSGKVRFPLPELEEGLHTLGIKAWDVANNPAEYRLSFRVSASGQLTLEHVLNYPNPFTTQTRFWFNHNRPGEPLDVTIQLFTLSGKLVKTLRNAIISEGNRSSEIHWDGRDEFGDRLGRGAYLYSIQVRSPDGKTARQWQKLYIL